MLRTTIFLAATLAVAGCSRNSPSTNDNDNAAGVTTVTGARVDGGASSAQPMTGTGSPQGTGTLEGNDTLQNRSDNSGAGAAVRENENVPSNPVTGSAAVGSGRTGLSSDVPPDLTSQPMGRGDRGGSSNATTGTTVDHSRGGSLMHGSRDGGVSPRLHDHNNIQ